MKITFVCEEESLSDFTEDEIAFIGPKGWTTTLTNMIDSDKLSIKAKIRLFCGYQPGIQEIQGEFEYWTIKRVLDVANNSRLNDLFYFIDKLRRAAYISESDRTWYVFTGPTGSDIAVARYLEGLIGPIAKPGADVVSWDGAPMEAIYWSDEFAGTTNVDHLLLIEKLARSMS